MTTVLESTAVSPADKQLLLEIKTAILALLPTATVILYGSAARGMRQPDSDYDLLVLTDASLTADEQAVVDRKLLNIELETGAIICAIYKTKKDCDSPRLQRLPFHLEVDRDAVVL